MLQRRADLSIRDRRTTEDGTPRSAFCTSLSLQSSPPPFPRKSKNILGKQDGLRKQLIMFPGPRGVNSSVGDTNLFANSIIPWSDTKVLDKLISKPKCSVMTQWYDTATASSAITISSPRSAYMSNQPLRPILQAAYCTIK